MMMTMTMMVLFDGVDHVGKVDDTGGNNVDDADDIDDVDAVDDHGVVDYAEVRPLGTTRKRCRRRRRLQRGTTRTRKGWQQSSGIDVRIAWAHYTVIVFEFPLVTSVPIWGCL